MLRWLPPKERKRRNKRIVYLRDVKGLSWQEIAGRFDLANWTVRAAYKKAKEINHE